MAVAVRVSTHSKSATRRVGLVLLLKHRVRVRIAEKHLLIGESG